MSDFFQSGNEGGRDSLIVTYPPHFPTMHTRETVTHLAAFGLDENQVAAILRCSPDDVRRYYADEMEHGLTRVNARVMSAVLHQALFKEDTVAMKLWLVNKAGWRSGDGARAVAVATGAGESADGETLTVVQRREVITKLLVRATQHKRQQERVIDAEVVPVAKSTNGNGTNGHGNGSNGAGNGSSGNGTKHR